MTPNTFTSTWTRPGFVFSFPWHRDVWYSAPAQQINWWLPIFPVRDGTFRLLTLTGGDSCLTAEAASPRRTCPGPARCRRSPRQ